ncbi:uncharacterized protein LOC125718980 isoform X2 [Brienomyrus brachyistius]|uniref:uncharacterized protein LOC125718980 isoform X2 n=1 Tax=Brienomyrus brachyistius TaxID=42636 RepID=UPI0020B32C10|nr:uncharacterized protein LOC125718980 isoform X2 [Brienomyrus brachyistius]
MQYWMHKKDRLSKRKLISHKYKNGILRREMDDQQYRFPHSDKELKMNDLQPTVAGEYFCNGIQVAVLTVSLDTGDHITQVTTKKTGADSFVEVYETENKETDTERVMATVVMGLCVLILFAALVCLFLWTKRSSRRKGNIPFSRNELEAEGPKKHQKGHDLDWESGHEECCFLKNEVDAHKCCLDEDTDMHYTCWGHRSWRERPYMQEEDSHVIVIYSLVADGRPDP